MAKTMEQSVQPNDISRISAGTAVKGEISSPLDIRIDGIFEGRVYSKGRIVVGEKAVVKGDIICQNADFWGTMNGNFFVKDTLSLKSGCTVNGNLHVKRLQVDLDSKFNGNCKMISDAEFDKLSGNMPAPVQVQEKEEPAPAPQTK
ncbi:MAG: polymer-forming cytoskeletal protein [Bacteroidales bacterium]|nr:polymer-forming cytoskeletal protein [Bacteroidales bacterium]